MSKPTMKSPACVQLMTILIVLVVVNVLAVIGAKLFGQSIRSIAIPVTIVTGHTVTSSPARMNLTTTPASVLPVRSVAGTSQPNTGISH